MLLLSIIDADYFALTSSAEWVNFTANKDLLTSFSAAPKFVGAPDPPSSSNTLPPLNRAHQLYRTVATSEP